MDVDSLDRKAGALWAELARFSEEYLKDHDPPAALMRCGVPAETAVETARSLMSREITWQFIEIARNRRLYLGDERYRNPPSPAFDNIYYCCSQKSGSQWIKAILLDFVVYRHLGMQVLPYVAFGNDFAEVSGPMPLKTIVAHLYVSREAYRKIPKPAAYKGFYVARDPRDALVSWYFSMKHSHAAIDPVPELRQGLLSRTEDDGYRWLVDRLSQFGVFRAQHSWFQADDAPSDALVVRYEDLAADEAAFLKTIFDHLEMNVSEAELADLVARHAFVNYAGGRRKGQEDVGSHYRLGTSGAWRGQLSQGVVEHFHRATGDLVEAMGYEW